jgi:hypothetical protein
MFRWYSVTLGGVYITLGAINKLVYITLGTINKLVYITLGTIRINFYAMS